MYSEKKISKYLEELASKSPAPGGGSASALVGATGAALLSKVANFTVGKEKYKSVEKEIGDVLKEAESLREKFIKLCSDDAMAYKKLSEAFKLPKDEGRDEKVQSALKEAMNVPLEICKKARGAIRLCIPLLKKGNRNLITDVGDAAIMLEAAFRAALLNVEVNLKSIKDKDFTQKIREITEAMEKEINFVSEPVKKELERGIK